MSTLTITAAAPFAPPAPVTALPAGVTIAEIVAHAYAHGLLDPAWDEALIVYVGAAEIPRDLWAQARPKPGQIVSLRPRPGDPGTIVATVWSIVQNVAIAFAVQAVVSAFTPSPKQHARDQIFQIDGARNEITRYRPWPFVLGTHRVFPPLAARYFTRGLGEKIYLYVLLGLGLGPISLQGELNKIGDTPLSAYPGAQWAARLAPGDPWPSVFPPLSPDEADGAGLIENADGWVERVTESDECDEIEAELGWLQGLVFYSNSGRVTTAQANFRLRYRQEDAEGGPGPWRHWTSGAENDDGEFFSWLLSRPKPFHHIFSRAVSRGRYRIGVKRESVDDDDPRYHSMFSWVKIRSFTHELPVTDPDLALLAVRVESGPQIGGIIDLINCVITRVAPRWDAGEEEWGAAAGTSNCAELARWVAMGPGLAVPYAADEIDQEGFGAWAELCTAKDWRCDIEIRGGIGFDALLELIAKCGRAVIGKRAGKLTPIIDAEQTAQSQLFTPRNSWGFRAQRNLPAPCHAYHIEFNNAAKDYVPDEMVVYFPGYHANNVELIETLAAPGKTRGLEVYRDGKRAIAERVMRGMTYVWNADWENLACARGRRTGFAHSAVAVGLQAARVAGLVLNEAETHVVALDLDEEITQQPGLDYALAWRGVAGGAFTVSDLALETIAGVGKRVVLAAEGGLPIASAPELGDLVEFGEAEVTRLDLVVQHIRRAGELEAEITAQAYVDALYEDDDAPEPEWDSGVSPSWFPAPPAPVIEGHAVSSEGVFVYFSLAPGAGAHVAAIEAWWRVKDDPAPPFERVATLDGAARQVMFPASLYLIEMEILLVAVSARGARAQSAVLSVVNGIVDRDAPNFTAVMTADMRFVDRQLVKEAVLRAVVWDDGQALLLDDDEPAFWDEPGWNARAYSAEAFVDGASALGIAAGDNKALMFGLARAPWLHVHFAALDYAWRLGGDGACAVWEAGVQVSSPEPYAAGDVFAVVYDGAFVRYYRNGVQKHATRAPGALALHFSSSFYDDDAALGGVAFAPAARGAEIVETRWKRSVAPPPTPAGAEPEGWTLEPIDGAEALWSISARKSSSGALLTPWSAPVLRSSPNWRGDWAADVIFYREDAVYYGGGSYRCTAPSVVGVAPSGSNQSNHYWSVIAAPPGPVAGAPFVASISVPASDAGVNLYDLAVAAGYTGGDATVTFTLASGARVRGLPGGAGIDTGGWPIGTHAIALTLTINGEAEGGGGVGGAAPGAVGLPGGRGGDAVLCRAPLTIVNNGVIRAGGGGGGGGAGMQILVAGDPEWLLGGGGGGGRPNGVGGVGAVNGAPANATAPGAGGDGANKGGAGGDFGAAGAAGAGSGGGAAGAAGHAVRKQGHAVSVSGAGAIIGAVG